MKRLPVFLGFITACFVLLPSFRFGIINFGSKRLADTIRINSGLISGEKSSDNRVTSFKGIPFAAAPEGALRWKAPQPVSAWEGVKKCVAFGPSPMQAKPVSFSMWTEEFLIP